MIWFFSLFTFSGDLDLSRLDGQVSLLWWLRFVHLVRGGLCSWVLVFFVRSFGRFYLVPIRSISDWSFDQILLWGCGRLISISLVGTGLLETGCYSFWSGPILGDPLFGVQSILLWLGDSAIPFVAGFGFDQMVTPGVLLCRSLLWLMFSFMHPKGDPRCWPESTILHFRW